MMIDLSINADLIERYMREGNLACLVSIFDFQRRQMTRAEDLSRAYLAQMLVLEARLKDSRGSEAPRSVPREARSTAEVRQPVPSVRSKPKAHKTQAIEIGDL